MAKTLGAMVPASLPVAHVTAQVDASGFPTPEFRAQLRRIPSWRNAWSVLFLYVQTGVIVWASIRWSPWVWPISVVLMGRAYAQFASLMHEAAHRLLFADKRLNDITGRWLLGFPVFTNTSIDNTNTFDSTNFGRVQFNSCSFNGTDNGPKIKSQRGRGGVDGGGDEQGEDGNYFFHAAPV